MLIESTYKRPWGLFNGHFETVYPAFFRKAQKVTYKHLEINTPDQDILSLALDDSVGKSDKLVIISHGLEGDAQRPYVKGMVRRFVQSGWHALAWNFRGCGGKMNLLPRFYHSGATEDLQTVVNYAHSLQTYKTIVLIGFSLGGNLTLKYVGEQATHALPTLKAAVVFSVPLHLSSCSERISRASNWVYAQKFKKSLKHKIREKATKMPHALDTKHLKSVRTLKDFDELYTAPLHGFLSAEDYYEKCSSLYALPTISLPTLIVNAQNDPLLSAHCFPKELLKAHKFVEFETPAHGGHCGFSSMHEGFYWSENRAFEWVEGKI